MYKVLHLMGGADIGGISSVVVNYYTHIDRTQIHFDIATTTNKYGINAEKLNHLGAIFFRVTLKSIDRKAFKQDLKKILIANDYDAIHVHENHTSWVALQVAKECGIKCRVAHAHTAGPQSFYPKLLLKQFIGKVLNAYYATNLIACGQKAGEFIFGRFNMSKSKAIILPNAIDTQKFSYDEIVRQKIRTELRIENRFVVGMVGRVASPKNNVGSLALFKAIKRRIPNAIFLIVGDGEDMPKLKKAICISNLQNDVVCLGSRNDVNQLFQAFDIYILPSFYEGFPVAAVEALATGLPVLLSDTITRELEFGSAVRYLPLNDHESWANAACEFIHDEARINRVSEIERNGLDIRQTSLLLQNLYLSYK